MSTATEHKMSMSLASCDDCGTVMLWEMDLEGKPRGQPRVLLEGQDATASQPPRADPVASVWKATAFNSEGTRLACGGRSRVSSAVPTGAIAIFALGTVREDCQLSRFISNGEAEITALAWWAPAAGESPQEELLAAGDVAGAVTIWNPTCLTCLRKISVDTGPAVILSLQWCQLSPTAAAPNSSCLAFCTDNASHPVFFFHCKDTTEAKVTLSTSWQQVPLSSTPKRLMPAVHIDSRWGIRLVHRPVGITDRFDVLSLTDSRLSPLATLCCPEGTGMADNEQFLFSQDGQRLIARPSGLIWHLSETGRQPSHLYADRERYGSKDITALCWSPGADIVASLTASVAWANAIRLWTNPVQPSGKGDDVASTTSATWHSCAILESSLGHKRGRQVTAVAWRPLPQPLPPQLQPQHAEPRAQPAQRRVSDAGEDLGVSALSSQTSVETAGGRLPPQSPLVFRPKGEQKKVKEIVGPSKADQLCKLIPKRSAKNALPLADMLALLDVLAQLFADNKMQVRKSEDREPIRRAWQLTLGVTIPDAPLFRLEECEQNSTLKRELREFIGREVKSWKMGYLFGYILLKEVIDRYRRWELRQASEPCPTPPPKSDNGLETMPRQPSPVPINHSNGQHQLGTPAASPLMVPVDTEPATGLPGGVAPWRTSWQEALDKCGLYENDPSPVQTPMPNAGGQTRPSAKRPAAKPPTPNRPLPPTTDGDSNGPPAKQPRVEGWGNSSGQAARTGSGLSETDRESGASGGGEVGGEQDADSDVEEDSSAALKMPGIADTLGPRAESSDIAECLHIALPESQPLDEELFDVPDTELLPFQPLEYAPGSDETPEAVPSPVVYDKQAEVAQDLLAKIQDQINSAKSGGAQFERFVFFIQVPNLNSLLGQTITRINEFLQAHREGHTGFFEGIDARDIVYKGAQSGTWCKMLEDVKARIAQEPKTLFLFVHDEAHWSPTVGTSGYFINDHMLRNSPNVFTLFVSATPYNLLTIHSQIPRENEHHWFTPNEETTYYGLNRYCESLTDAGLDPGCIVRDNHMHSASAKINLPKELRVQWLTLKQQQVQGKESSSAALRRLRMLVAMQARYVSAFLQAMGNVPSNLPAEVLHLPDGKPLETLPADDLTLQMVTKLVHPDRSGRGVMILLRVADQKSGKLLYNSMQRVRNYLGLQRRVGIIIDINQQENREDTNFGLKETIELPLRDKLLVWQKQRGVVGPDATEPLVRQYSDLQDLPCILILCEKGKMGDTFPKSLRYYDLRLRYLTNCSERAATEQDLGRAFRYVKKNDPELPTILVSHVLHTALKSQRSGRQGLLLKDPSRSDLMKRLKKGTGSSAFPDPKSDHPEADTEPYRSHWGSGPKHFDNPQNRKMASGLWEANPRRFALAAAPQIGKTGAFLHLIYLLWVQYMPLRGIDTSPDPDDDNEEGLQPVPPASGCMGLFPSAGPPPSQLAASSFRDIPQRGKYGDPRRREVWDWYMQGQNAVHPMARQDSTAAPTSAVQAGNTATSAKAVPDEAAMDAGEAEAACETFVTPDSVSQLWPLRFASQPAIGKAIGWQGRGVEVVLPAFTETSDRLSGRLHVPDSHSVAKRWLPMFPDGPFPLQIVPTPNATAEQVTVPIFVPSRARPTSALLDWGSSMAGTEYLQIVCVTASELALYKRNWPEHIFFELPPEAAALGIGASRFCIQYLASQMAVARNAGGARCCYVLDDSVMAWKVDCGLPDDPHSHAMKEMATLSESRQKRLCNIPMASVLQHFQDTSYSMKGIGVLGFHRFNGWMEWKSAYHASHVYSAVLLNLDELFSSGTVVYDPYVFMWEDIDFNRRVGQRPGSDRSLGYGGVEGRLKMSAASPALVVAKCNRFIVIKKNFEHGGCREIVAQPPLLPGDTDTTHLSSIQKSPGRQEEGEPPVDSRLEPEPQTIVPLQDLSHVMVGRLVEWALARKWGTPNNRHAQFLVGRLLAEQGVDGTLLHENNDLVDELRNEIKGATRRQAVKEAVQAVQQQGGVPLDLLTTWEQTPDNEPLPSSPSEAKSD